MKIPKKLKIGGHIYTILQKKEWDNSSNEDGYCDTTKNEICILSTIPQSQQEAVLIHEIFHALNCALSHELLSSLSEQLYQTLKDNKLIK